MSSAFKHAALALVNRCSTVVDGELGTLKKWEIEPGVGIGRQASCAQSKLAIGVGPLSPRTRVDDVISKLSAASDDAVTRAPAAPHAAYITGVEQSQKARSATFAASMSQLAFDDGLLMAEENARRTAEIAELILLDVSPP